MDARLFINDETFSMDLGVFDGALAVDEGMFTAVAISLFTDRRADPDDPLPGRALSSKPERGLPGVQTDRRGWWADAFPVTVDGVPASGDRIGSRLWLLSREKIVPETLKRAEFYIREALQWMIDDGIAASIDVTVEAQRQSILAFGIVVHRPSGDSPRFDFLWDGQEESTGS